MYYLVGGAGYRNFGDELMVKCWLDFLAKNKQKKEIVIDGAIQEYLDDTFALDYPSLVTTDLINRLGRVGELPDFWSAVIRGLEFNAKGGFEHYPHLSEQMERLLSADVIHLHGGGYLNKHFPRKGFLLGCIVSVARRTGARLVATGIGMTPLDTPSEEQLKRLGDWIAQFEVFETRDSASADMLNRLFPGGNVIKGLDDTFLGNFNYTNDGLKRLHLSWDEGQMDEPAFSRIREYLDNFSQLYDQIVFWKCAPNDAGTWKALKKEYPRIAGMTFDRLVYGPLPVASGDHMLTARFHPHFIASRAGAVGGYFSPGQYYDVKHGSVLECGSGFFALGDKKITPEQFDKCKNTIKKNEKKYTDGKMKLALDIYR